MMRCWALVTLAVGVALGVAASACDDDDGADTTPGSGGSIGTTTTGTGTGAGGTTTTAAGGTGAGSGCHGDADAWAQIQKTDIPCVNNSDCCVVFNGCLGEGQVVSADDYPTAGDVWPYCDSDCVLCALPIVEVECHQSECVGYELPPDEDAGVFEGQAHCGVDDPIGTLVDPGMLFSCAP